MVLVLLFLATLTGFGQSTSKSQMDSVDAVITVIGRDQTVLPLPPLWRQKTVLIPDILLWQPPAIYLPPVEPPIGESSGDGWAAADPMKDIDP